MRNWILMIGATLGAFAIGCTVASAAAPRHFIFQGVFDTAEAPSAGVKCYVFRTPASQRKIIRSRELLSCSPTSGPARQWVIGLSDGGIVVIGPPARNGLMTYWFTRSF